jgi:sensor histidine kinase YesM
MNITDLVICLVSLVLYSVTFAGLFFLLPGYETRRSKTQCVIAGVIFAALTVVINLFVPPEDMYSVFDILLMVLSFITPYLVFVAKKKLVFLGFSGVLMIAFDYIRVFILSLMPKYNLTDRREALISCAIYFVVLLLLAVFHRQLKSKIPEGFIEGVSPFIYVIVYIAFFASSYESMLGRGEVYDSAISSVLKLISTGLIIVAVFYLVFRYFNLLSKQKEAEMQLEAELNHYEEAMQKNRDIRAFRHDYKNNLISLNALIESGRNDEAREYISDLTGSLEQTAFQYNTGNYLADAIISEKAKTAGAMNISIAFDGRIPAEGIKNSDLCTILANSIDNAVRACEEQAPCEISISSEMKKSGVILKIANPVKEKVVIKNNSIKTTKSDKLNHGLGIGNVKKAAADYGGTVTLSCTDSEFCIEIVLPV